MICREEKISIIVPVYNVETYLRECLDSVCNQTYRNLEIILIDDGSTDSSGVICDAYAAQDNRISVIHKTNGGQSSARNTGLDTATGKYVLFVDSDDYICTNLVEEAVCFIQSSGSDFIFFDGECFSEIGRGDKLSGNYKRSCTYQQDLGCQMFQSLVQNGEYHCHVALMLIQRAFLERHHFRFVEGIIYEDEIFTYQLYAKARSVAYFAKSLYNHRIRPNSTVTSAKSARNFKSICRVVSEIDDFAFDEKYAMMESVNQQLARFSMNAISCFRELKKAERNKCHADYAELSGRIKKREYYESIALRMKCKGDICWVLYKCVEKLTPGKRNRRRT